MNAYETIYEMMLTYPDLFHNSAEACNHLFLTIGNGCEWKNGELVSDAPMCHTIKDAIHRVIEDSMNRVKFYSTDMSYGKALNKIVEREIERANNCVNGILNAEWNLASLGSSANKFKFDELNKYSAIANIPDDITNSWLFVVNRFSYDLVLHKDSIKDPDGLLDGIRNRVLELLKRPKSYHSLD